MPALKIQPNIASHTHVKTQLLPRPTHGHVPQDITHKCSLTCRKRATPVCSKAHTAVYVDAHMAFRVYMHPHISAHTRNLAPVLFLTFPVCAHQLCSSPSQGPQSPTALACLFGSLRLQRVNQDQRGGPESKLMMKMSPPCLCLN